MRMFLSKETSKEDIKQNIVGFIHSPFSGKEEQIRNLFSDKGYSEEYIQKFFEVSKAIEALYEEVKGILDSYPHVKMVAGMDRNGVIQVQHKFGHRFGYDFLDGTSSTREALEVTRLMCDPNSNIQDCDVIASTLQETYEVYQEIHRVRSFASVKLDELYALA